jgi:hypothetical protein
MYHLLQNLRGPGRAGGRGTAWRHDFATYVPADLVPETPRPVMDPAPRKTLSWLPRRTKAGSSSAPNVADAPTKPKNKRSSG